MRVDRQKQPGGRSPSLLPCHTVPFHFHLQDRGGPPPEHVILQAGSRLLADYAALGSLGLPARGASLAATCRLRGGKSVKVGHPESSECRWADQHKHVCPCR